MNELPVSLFNPNLKILVDFHIVYSLGFLNLLEIIYSVLNSELSILFPDRLQVASLCA